MVLILGTGRSGTTWIGRIFDTAPDVFYVHEPDLLLPSASFPVNPAPEAYDFLVSEAKAYLDGLRTSRAPKAMGSRPVFAKPYRDTVSHWTRATLIYGVRAMEAIRGRSFERLEIPDLMRTDRSSLTVVIKSVTGLGRLPVFARTAPDMPILHVIRHPCAVVASLVRGVELGKMPEQRLHTPQYALPLARERGLMPARVTSMSQVQIAAWRWTLAHDTALRGTPTKSNVRTVRYEDLCADPLGVSRELFDWAGITWSRTTEWFLNAPANTSGRQDYHSVSRDPAATVHKWRHQLTGDEIAAIKEVVRGSAPAAYYPDLKE